MRERLNLKHASEAQETDLLLAVARFMGERVTVSPVGRGAFEVGGRYNDVALIGLDALTAPKVDGVPVALLRLGGNRFFAGDRDAEALERIANIALSVSSQYDSQAARAPLRPTIGRPCVVGSKA